MPHDKFHAASILFPPTLVGDAILRRRNPMSWCLNEQVSVVGFLLRGITMPLFGYSQTIDSMGPKLIIMDHALSHWSWVVIVDVWQIALCYVRWDKNPSRKCSWSATLWGTILRWFPRRMHEGGSTWNEPSTWRCHELFPTQTSEWGRLHEEGETKWPYRKRMSQTPNNARMTRLTHDTTWKWALCSFERGRSIQGDTEIQSAPQRCHWPRQILPTRGNSTACGNARSHVLMLEWELDAAITIFHVFGFCAKSSERWRMMDWSSK